MGSKQNTPPPPPPLSLSEAACLTRVSLSLFFYLLLFAGVIVVVVAHWTTKWFIRAARHIRADPRSEHLRQWFSAGVNRSEADEQETQQISDEQQL